MEIDKKNIDHLLTHNIAAIYPNREEFEKKLVSGDTLTFYLGIDPNVPDVHLGHALVYKKLEEFRRLGHKVICLLGDFTARIGDPTDKSATRIRLTEEQVKQNAQAYKEQVSKVLNFDDSENPAELKFNSEWLEKLNFADLIEIAAYFTVQQMIERDMYQQRIKDNKPIYLHEFFYPLMQGYDSVAMDVDVEIGGTDQTFNMLAGRDLLHATKGKEKYVITCTFLMGTDGQKMSKSLGNYISLRESPFEMFRKIMTLHDNMIVHYFDMVLDKSQDELKEVEDTLSKGENPMNIKKELAHDIVEWLFDPQAAADAQKEFENIVQKDEMPQNIPTLSANVFDSTSVPLILALTKANFAQSNSESRRLIEQGAVKVNDEKITDVNFQIEVKKDTLIQAGKGKWVKIITDNS